MYDPRKGALVNCPIRSALHIICDSTAEYSNERKELVSCIQNMILFVIYTAYHMNVICCNYAVAPESAM